VTEKIDGRTLRAVLADERRHPSPNCIAWIDQMLDAVATAHAHGVIHRDLKPENMLVVARPDAIDLVKILDFGLATFRTTGSDENGSVTAPGLVLGTVAYMAPEQLAGHAVDERADVFSLGVVIFEMLTGQRPFSSNPLVRFAEIGRGIPSSAFADARVREALAPCLDDEPSRRYASVADVRRVLLPVVTQFVADTCPGESQQR
jgi:serine/threonine protein kinase